MKLDIFIEGETIDLRIPTLEFAEKSDWYKWFNNPEITQYLEQGQFPNTYQDQIFFFEGERKRRLILIATNKLNEIIGVTSISKIDHAKKTGELGIVRSLKSKTPLETLEIVARITQHAFSKIGLKRIVAGHHISLISFSHRLSLLGYRLDGIGKKAFIKGDQIHDSLITASHYDDYKRIIKNRNGNLWDSKDLMLQRLQNLPQKTIHWKLQNFFKRHNEYYQKIFDL